VFAHFYMPASFPAAAAAQNWALVPGRGHDEACMFGSAQFASASRGALRGGGAGAA